MAATRQDIKAWLATAPEGATHMIVLCDEFAYEDFPKYVTGDAETVQKMVEAERDKALQRVMEVYNLSEDHLEQVNRYRCWNY